MGCDQEETHVLYNLPLAATTIRMGGPRLGRTVFSIVTLTTMLWNIPCVLAFSKAIATHSYMGGRITSSWWYRSALSESRSCCVNGFVNIDLIPCYICFKDLGNYHIRRHRFRKSSAMFISPKSNQPESLPNVKSPCSSPENWSRAMTIDTDVSVDSNVVGENLTELDLTENLNTAEKRIRKGSRFGVRSRVRSVLKKARNRTGIANNSDKEQRTSRQTSQSVIAEAVSIGGLGAVLLDEEGTVDVALDFYDTGSNITDGSARIRVSDKTLPASTYSPPPVQITRGPEDLLRPASTTRSNGVVKGKSNKSTAEVPLTIKDAFTGDVSAAFSVPPSPLPFTLPKLTTEQEAQVDRGERVQYQSDMGLEGSGFVVMDVNAPSDAVWDCLLDFESYPETIPTVRDVKMMETKPPERQYGIPSETRASFTLSKFRLRIAAVHKYSPHPQGHYMVFTLDPTCTNLVLQNAKGVWHTQENVNGKNGVTRVWLLCELKVSNMLPKFIVDYAARKAMPRATAWLKPQVEAASALWLRKPKNKSG